MDIKALREKATGWIGKYKYFAAILLVGIAFMLIPIGEKEQKESPVTAQPVQQTQLSEELEGILSNVKGAGRVRVMLSIAGGEQTIYQTDQSSQERQDTVIITQADRSQAGLIQQVLSPTYRGAIVLCQGADSPSVCLAIKDAVAKVTGLDSSEISVLKMK